MAGRVAEGASGRIEGGSGRVNEQGVLGEMLGSGGLAGRVIIRGGCREDETTDLYLCSSAVSNNVWLSSSSSYPCCVIQVRE